MSRSTPLTVTKGSCIDFDLVYADENGDAEDVSSDTFTVSDASSDAFDDAVITKTDPTNGVVHFHLDERDPETLRLGNLSWVRIARTSPSGCVDNSEQIWINIT